MAADGKMARVDGLGKNKSKRDKKGHERGQGEKEQRDYFVLTKSQKAKIKEKIKAILKRHKGIKTALLYGSFVNAKYFHDIDIALIGNVGLDEKLELGEKLNEALGFETDVKVFKSQTEMPELFRFLVFKDGEILINKDKSLESKRWDFVKCYIDFLEWRRLRWKLEDL
jgi:predicted nucleotidyltransferase